MSMLRLEQQVLRERIAGAHLEIAPHAVEGEASSVTSRKSSASRPR